MAATVFLRLKVPKFTRSKATGFLWNHVMRTYYEAAAPRSSGSGRSGGRHGSDSNLLQSSFRLMTTLSASPPHMKLWAQRFESTSTSKLPESRLHKDDADEDDKWMDSAGGKIGFTSEMSFTDGGCQERRIPCYRVLDNSGQPVSLNSHYEQVHEELAIKMYSAMVTLQIMDTFLYEAQRQGRISFYMATSGEEALNIASAAALKEDDVVFAQYREPGVLLWRGFTVQDFTNQCFSNKDDGGKGRQMPSHYGSKTHNFFTISSPIATQIPQAVGAAYSLKMEDKDACIVAYMGDGCTSEGDFHAGMNFAAVLEVPIVFFCRNNGWAISTPTTEQFRSDGIVVKGQAYGIRSIRVDGNDALAVYNVVRVAREMAVKERIPILIEALTYRVAHHSTSDDSTKYRPRDEIEHWKTIRNPLTRFRNWVESNGWWRDKDEVELRSRSKKEMINAIQTAERMQKPALSEMFTDVYDAPMSNLVEQERVIRETVMKHPQDYPTNCPF